METHKIYPSYLTESSLSENKINVWAKYLAFVDSQSSYSLAWWIGSLSLQSILLPLTFLFVYSWGGPALPSLAISMTCFFTNVISNMGGASFRFRFNSFLISLIIHVALIVTTIILTSQGNMP